ncbi:hypothetical protein KCG48_04995 [Proteiniclasticum sp. BAD-10]|uniref:Uncharacterized protein n=1 Tax=Proteiniclasticum sediminis TaxID=2804028 RepID=A0A941HR01_9CLOT|nr:hypothetical protein [Proteiniclasticum sediminis]MBR0575697.1 hypothetical protein [Proteiniclasticum sediminis]
MEIKVELFFNVSMFGTDWMMTAAEYEEFRSKLMDLPMAMLIPKIQDPDPVFRPTTDEECPDYIEPPEEDPSEEASRFLPKEITEEIAEIAEIAEKSTKAPENVQKTEEKAQPERIKPDDRDYSKYIQMLAEDFPPGKIIDQMRDDFGVSRGSAQNYFYRFVKPSQQQAEAIPTEDPRVALQELKKEREKKLDNVVKKLNSNSSLQTEISDLPDYQTANEFKDAIIIQEIGKNKQVKELKEIYLRTHPHIKW